MPCLTCTAETPFSWPRNDGPGSDLGGTVQYMIAIAMKATPSTMPTTTSRRLLLDPTSCSPVVGGSPVKIPATLRPPS